MTDKVIEVFEGETVYVFMPEGQLGHINGPVVLEIHKTGEPFITSKGSYVLSNAIDD